MSPTNPRNPWGEAFKGLNDFTRWYLDLERRTQRWFDERRPAIQAFVDGVAKFADELPVVLAIGSVMFHRGGWSEVPLDDMDMGEFSGLITILTNGLEQSEEEVRQELDGALGEYFRRDDHAALSKMVSKWGEHFTARQYIFRDALWAHEQGRYTLSIPALAAQVEGILRDLTEEYGRRYPWIERLNDAFGYGYDRKEPAPPPTIEEIVAEFRALPASTRYERAEELKTHLALRSINELYENGEFSDPEFTSSVRRHPILHGVFTNFGELESLRLFFILGLLHKMVSDYKERVWIVPARPTHLPILRQWHDEDLELERRLSGFYADGRGWVKELVEHEERRGWIVCWGGQPAGFADLDVDHDTALGYLSMYVSQGVRGAGVGTVAAKRVVEEARSIGVAGVIAYVQPDNEAAIRCVEKAGLLPLDEYDQGGRERKFALRFGRTDSRRSSIEEQHNGYE